MTTRTERLRLRVTRGEGDGALTEPQEGGQTVERKRRNAVLMSSGTEETRASQ